MAQAIVKEFQNKDDKPFLNPLLQDSVPTEEYDSERKVKDYYDYRDFVFQALEYSFGELKHELDGLKTYLANARDRVDKDFYYEILYIKYQDLLDEKYNQYRKARELVHDSLDVRGEHYNLQMQCLTLLHFITVCNEYFESVPAFQSLIMYTPLLEEGKFQYKITWSHPFGETMETVVHANELAAAELIAKYKLATENKISVLRIQIRQTQQLI